MRAKLSEKVAKVVQDCIGTYRAGFATIPDEAFVDPYVVGYINAFVLGVTESILRRPPGHEKWQVLEQVWSMLSPRKGRQSYQISLDEFNKPTESYLRGVGAGDLYVEIIKKGITRSAPQAVLEAVTLAESMTEQRPVPAEAIGGALIVRDLHAYIRNTHSPDQPMTKPELEEFTAARSALLRASDRLTTLDEEINAIIKLIKRKQVHLGQDPETPRIVFVDWEGRPAIMIGTSAWFVGYRSTQWEQARLEEVADSGRVLSDIQFVQTFPNRPPLTLEMAGLGGAAS